MSRICFQVIDVLDCGLVWIGGVASLEIPLAGTAAMSFFLLAPSVSAYI